MRFLSIAAFAGLAAATHVSAHKLSVDHDPWRPRLMFFSSPLVKLVTRMSMPVGGIITITIGVRLVKPGSTVAAKIAALVNTARAVTMPCASLALPAPFQTRASLLACARLATTSTVAGLPTTPAAPAQPATPAARAPRAALLAPPTLGLRQVVHAKAALLAIPRARLLDPASPNARPALPLARPAPVAPSPTPAVLPAARPAQPEPPAALVPLRALPSTARPESTLATARAPAALPGLTAAPTLPLARPALPTRFRPVVPLPAPPARLVPLACPVLPSARLPAKQVSTSRTASATPAPPVGTPRLAPPSAPTALKTPTPTPALALALSARPARDAVAARLRSTSALTSAPTARSTPTDAAKTAQLAPTATTTCVRIARLVRSPTPAPSPALSAQADPFLRPTARLALPARATLTRAVTAALLARLPSRRAQPVFTSCPSGQQRCDVWTGRGGSECINTLTHSESCGGCVAPEGMESSDYTGKDCTAIPNVGKVSCDAGRCNIITCSPGFERDGDRCVPSHSAHKNTTSHKRSMISRHDSF
ncbi:hypothetical protein RhiJN_00409 [Ceratobasidium sp. AG-Ba]|nr:hypothetical protein RhiJN_00409 [Ceratobasidium sp. AG-Ba]